MRAGFLFPSLSMLEQTSKKSRPDLLISGCSGVLFGPVRAGEQTKKTPRSAGTISRRTPASNQWRDYTSDLRCCLQSETSADWRAPALASVYVQHHRVATRYFDAPDLWRQRQLPPGLDAGSSPSAAAAKNIFVAARCFTC